LLHRFGVPVRYVRIAVQGFVFALWVALLLATRHPMESWLLQILPASLFLRADPLVLTVVAGGMRMGISLLMLGFVTLAVSVLLGRVFCGWVCPLGTVFDAYGWILRRLRIRTDGPSPSWFRFKYYLLLAILVFAVLGGVSPLMGLDPIVLFTRVVASVLAPVADRWNGSSLRAGGPLGFNGSLIDGASLILFLGIMAGTTRLSRIWCRTACPLGAYLGAFSRHAVLRRETQGCVQCNICANHCPTGAIAFDNQEITIESECIKCFTCSQVCPVDANFFTLKNPIPAVTETYAPVRLERRAVLATSAAAVVATPGLLASGGAPGSQKALIRPPMSREEKDFLTSCIRCGECVKACPSGILKPAGLEHGLRALWTPVMVATEGACVQGCNACSQACPTDAILKYPIQNKYDYKAGTAIFETSRCVSYTDGKFCSECVRACPTDAIVWAPGWEPELAPGQPKQGADQPAPAGQVPSRPIKIRFESCVGCGACENVCEDVVPGRAAMIITSWGRATATELKK
jgi:polyferredoxin